MSPYSKTTRKAKGRLSAVWPHRSAGRLLNQPSDDAVPLSRPRPLRPSPAPAGGDRRTPPAGRVPNVLLLLEHPPVLTLGRNANRSNILASGALLAQRGVTIHEINRGGDVTYHGPGQLVGYPIFDLRTLHNPSGGRMGPVDFVRLMEEALIRLCGRYGVLAGRVAGLTGVWCGGHLGRDRGDSVPSTKDHNLGANQPAEKLGALKGHDRGTQTVSGPGAEARASSTEALQVSEGLGAFKGHDFSRADKANRKVRALAPEGSFSGNLLDSHSSVAASNTAVNQPAASVTERKIAAIGIHVARGITSHGFAFNVTTNLSDFSLIIPCGIPDHPVTSLEQRTSLARHSSHSRVHRPPNRPPLRPGLSEQVLAVESLAALRAQAAATPPASPAQDTPLQVPSEVERLTHTASRPTRA